jgi:adhesin/invasin
MRVFANIARWGLFACALAACGDPYVPPTLEGIRMQSGNQQTGIFGGPLAEQLVVSAYNQDDQPIAGARVQFSAPSGSFDQAVKFSDVEGLVKVTYTVGSTPGPITITATTLAGESKVEFTATAEPGPATQFTIISGNTQSAVVGSTLTNPLRVRVRNQYGVGLPGIPVTWTVEGQGQVSETSSVTDATGYAQVSFTLGEQAGADTVTASAAGLTALTFTATATEPPPPPPPAEPLE